MGPDKNKRNPLYEDESFSRFVFHMLAAGIAVLVIGAFIYFKTPARDLFIFHGQQNFSRGESAPSHNFTPYFRARGIDPIDPAELSKTVSDNLLLLEKDPCNWSAVEAAGTALIKKNALRDAAGLYLGFAQTCPSDEQAERIAANLFLVVKDYEKARALFTSLTTRFPGDDLDWYHRAQSEHGLGMTNEAIQSFANTLALMKDQKHLGERFFTEYSSVYASVGRFCEAMTPISTYLALDPAQRDTARVHTILETLSNQGDCRSYANGSDSFPVLGSGVILVKAQINGVPGTFVVDTGASFVAVGPRFAERAKITAGSAETFSTANGEASGQVSKAETIKIGKLQADTVPVVVMSKDLRNSDGLLGQSFLSRFEMIVKGSTLTLTSRSVR